MRPYHRLPVPALLLALTALPASAAPAPPTDVALTRTIDRYLKPMVARGDLSGQLLVTRDNRVVLERSFGQADRELGVAVTPETRFNIASVTKPMTAIVAMQLIDEKKLDAKDPLAKWLPGFPRGDSILVEHLLSHTSGIPHEIVPDSEMTRPFTAAEIAARAMRLPLDFAPGSQNRYSSGGYEVLARVLELASGMSYGDLVRTRLFAKLQMAHSAHVDSRTLMPGRAAPYVPGPRGIENAAAQDFSGIVGAGSVWSTARDLHRFVHAVRTGGLGEGAKRSYVRRGRLDFNGRTSGFKAWARWDSTSNVEIVFAGNLATGAPDALRGDLPRLARGESVPPFEAPALKPELLAATDMRRWEGVYEVARGPRLELRIRDGAMYCNDWLLLPTTDGRWFSPRDYGVISGAADAQGRITRLDWIQSGETYPAPRTGD